MKHNYIIRNNFEPTLRSESRGYALLALCRAARRKRRFTRRNFEFLLPTIVSRRRHRQMSLRPSHRQMSFHPSSDQSLLP